MAISQRPCPGQFFCGLGAALAIVGAGVGALTDFSGPTISLRP